MKYTYNDKEKNETVEVPAERWGWGVVYSDGTELKQFGDDGVFHRIGEIEQDRIALAVLYKLDDPSKRIDLPWRKGMKLVHLYRNVKPYYKPDAFIRVYVWGYKFGKHTHYTFILPDDRVIISPVDDIDLVKFEI